MLNELISKISEPEHSARFALLIDELAKLTDIQTRQAALSRMQAALNSQHELLSESEFSSIINYLVSLKNNDLLPTVTTFGPLNGFFADKAVTGLARSLAFVHEPHNGDFEICLLTNLKYFDKNLQLTQKYKKNDQRVLAGSGAYKTGKTYLSITLDHANQLQFNAGIRLRINIENVEDNLDDQYIENINMRLAYAYNPQEVVNVLYDIDKRIKYKVSREYASFVFGEVNTSRAFFEQDIASLKIANPFLKKSGNQCYLKIHLFDKLAFYRDLGALLLITPKDVDDIPRTISERFTTLSKAEQAVLENDLLVQNVPELFENLLNKILQAVAKIHRQGIIHGDLKSSNILLTENLEIIITDFGASVNLPASRASFKELLVKLGYVNDLTHSLADSFVASDVFYNLFFDQELQDFKVAPQLSKQEVPSIESLNEILYNISPLILMRFSEMLTTVSHVSPDVYACQLRIYERFDKNYFGPEIVKRLKYHEGFFKKTDLRNDLWSLGVITFQLCFMRMVRYNDLDLAIIMANPLLLAMLHPDIEQRANIEQIIAMRMNFPKIIIPQECDVLELSNKYIVLICNLDVKLRLRVMRHKLLMRIMHWNDSVALLAEQEPGTLNEQALARMVTRAQQAIFEAIDTEFEEGSLLDDQSFFAEPAISDWFFYSFLVYYQRQQLLFTNCGKECLALYLGKYINLLMFDHASNIVNDIELQIYNLFKINRFLSQEDKDDVLSDMVFTLVNGCRDCTYNKQVLLAARLLDITSNINPLNLQQESLLHRLFSVDNQVAYELKMLSCTSQFYSDENSLLYSRAVLFFIKNKADISWRNAHNQSVFAVIFANKPKFIYEDVYTEVVQIILDNNPHIPTSELEQALCSAILFANNKNVVFLLIARLLSLENWCNYALIIGVTSLWDVCAAEQTTLFSERLAMIGAYVRELKCHTLTLLDDLHHKIMPRGLTLCVAALWSKPKHYRYFNGYNDGNILYCLAMRPDICETINFCPGLLATMIAHKVGSVEGFSQGLINNYGVGLLVVDFDLYKNLFVLVLQHKNVAFILLILRELSQYLNFSEYNQFFCGLRNTIFSMIDLQIDLQIVITYLRSSLDNQAIYLLSDILLRKHNLLADIAPLRFSLNSQDVLPIKQISETHKLSEPMKPL